MKKHIIFGSIINKEKLNFKDNNELEKYYEHKWKTEGYSKGFILNGVPISEMFQEGRLKSALKNLEPKENEIILDAGCGNGSLSEKISESCKKVYAVDIAKSSFNKDLLKKHRNIEFKKMNIEKMAFKNEFFDKIVCVETIEHVLDPDKALSEFNRVLKKDGILVMSYPILENTKLGKIEKFLRMRKDTLISEHLTEWDFKQTVDTLKKHGFELEKSEGVCLDIGKFAKLKRINAFLARKITEFQLSIHRFPKNSIFVTFVFKKT